MRIGFDGKRLFKNFTGLGNYSRYLVGLLLDAYPDDPFFIYSPVTPRQELSERYRQATIRTPAPGFGRSLWRSFGIVKDLQKDRIDLYHGLSNEIPFGIASLRIASVVTVHDLIFLKYPQYYPLIDRMIYRLKVRYACRKANRVIAISEQTRRDISTLLHTEPGKIDVVYQDCDPAFKIALSPAELAAIQTKYALPDQFLLNVGTIEERKNLLLLVQALTKVRQPIHVVVVGKETPYARKVKDLIAQEGLGDRVHFLKNIPFDDLPGIYQLAEAFIYPSRYEGFGIPVVEALHSGVPVIAATGSCLEEAGGSGSLYTDPDNFEQLASLISTVLDNPEKRKEMIAEGKVHTRNFDRERIAGKMMEVYQKAIHDVKQ